MKSSSLAHKRTSLSNRAPRRHPNELSVYVTAHLDAKAKGISHWVLSGAKALRKSHDASPDKFDGQIQVSRRHPMLDTAMGIASSIVPLSVAALGVAMPIAGQASIGVGLLLAAFGVKLSLFTSNGILTACKAKKLNNSTEQGLNGQLRDAPNHKTPEERLRANVDEARRDYPNSRQLVYLSGHGGDRKTVAGLELSRLRKVMKDSKVDITILDTCSSCSLEVMSNLSPWAGLVAASSHEVYAFGYPLKKVLCGENLDMDNKQDMAVAMSKACSKWTRSMNLIDATRMKEKLMPALGQLAEHLNKELENGNRSIKKAYRKTDSVGLLPGRHKYLASFLSGLDEANLSEQGRDLVSQAREELSKIHVYSQNDCGLTFHSEGDRSLPPEWNRLQKSLRLFGVL